MVPRTRWILPLLSDNRDRRTSSNLNNFSSRMSFKALGARASCGSRVCKPPIQLGTQDIDSSQQQALHPQAKVIFICYISVCNLLAPLSAAAHTESFRHGVWRLGNSQHP